MVASDRHGGELTASTPEYGVSITGAPRPRAAEPRTTSSPSLWSDTFLSHSLALTLAVNVLNAASWLYHLVMSRVLGPVEYGALSALIGLLIVFAVPVNAIHMGVSAFVARARANKQPTVIASILNQAFKGSLLAGASAFAVLALISGWMMKALKLDSPVPVLLVGTVLIPYAALPILRGVLQGAQRFGPLGLSIAAEGILKLGGGVVLVTLGLGLSGAIGGVSLGAMGALGLTLVALRGFWRAPDAGEGSDLRGLLRSLMPYGAALGCFTVLTQADVVLVKALFPPHDAGMYAAASTGGKVVLYLISALPMVMLPEMARRDATDEDGRTVLKQGLVYGGLAGGAVVTAYLLAPASILRILFGSAYVGAAPLLAPLGFAMLCYALALFGMYYQLGARRFAFLPGMAAVAAVFPIVLWFLRRGVYEVALLMAALGLLTFVAVWWPALRRTEREGHAA